MDKFGLNKDNFASHNEYMREYKRLWRKTEKGKAAYEKWSQSEVYRLVKRKYNQSEKGKAKNKETTALYRQSIKGIIIGCINSSKNRAIEKNCPHDIDFSFMSSIYPKDGICPHRKVVMKPSIGSGGSDIDSPTIDRIKPELGYIKGNVQWLSMEANRKKGCS